MYQQQTGTRRKKKFITAEKLIALVRDRPPLWNKKIKEHRNPELISSLWEQVGEELNIPGELAAKKFKNMRDTFVRECRKVSTSRMENENENDVYEPGWSLYRSLMFLKDTVTIRSPGGSFIGLSPEMFLKKSELNNEIEAPEVSEEIVIPDIICEETDENVNIPSTSSSSDPSPIIVSSRSLKRKRVTNGSSEKFSPVPGSTTQNLSDSDTEHGRFAMSLVPHLKKVPEHLQGQCQLQLLQVVVSFAAGIIPKKLINIMQHENTES